MIILAAENNNLQRRYLISIIKNDIRCVFLINGSETVNIKKYSLAFVKEG
jgi:sRNA-binding regulator protein Hfq